MTSAVVAEILLNCHEHHKNLADNRLPSALLGVSDAMVLT